jgi:omega-hydroxy-beta-dihydromenaquinone-9 sulfotransferase
MKKFRFVLTQQPLVFGSFKNWLRLIIKHPKIDFKYIPRALLVSFLTFSTIPLRIVEKVRFREEIKNLEITQEPIFILGHWRSGTTHLHNLMCLDENFGYVSTFQTLAPEFFLSKGKFIKTIVGLMLPPTRPMDRVQVSIDYPHEEEFALANVSPFSFYHGWYFPKNMRQYFDNFVLFKGISQGIIDQWKKAYLNIIKKATISENKKLLLKSPTNTARIKVLLEIFPNAKFIHIYRNPYDVYLSTKKLYDSILPVFGFQTIDKKDIEANVLYFYKEMMQKFIQEKHLIPKGNFVEVKYEDLEVEPLAELNRVYGELNLAGFDKVEGKFARYTNDRQSYKKNKYVLSDKAISNISQEWSFTIDMWGYDLPSYTPMKLM